MCRMKVAGVKDELSPLLDSDISCYAISVKDDAPALPVKSEITAVAVMIKCQDNLRRYCNCNDNVRLTPVD